MSLVSGVAFGGLLAYGATRTSANPKDCLFLLGEFVCARGNSSHIQLAHWHTWGWYARTQSVIKKAVAIGPAGSLWSLALPTGNKLLPRPNLRPTLTLTATLGLIRLSAGPIATSYKECDVGIRSFDVLPSWQETKNSSTPMPIDTGWTVVTHSTGTWCSYIVGEMTCYYHRRPSDT